MTSRHLDNLANTRNTFATAIQSLEALLTELSAQIQAAAGLQDFNSVSALTKAATTIASYTRGITEEQERLGLMNQQSEARSFLIQITEGAVRNSYLSVTEGISRGWLSPGQTVEVEVPGWKTFSTLVMQANRLQERGLVSDFYSANQITAGDFVEFTEKEPGRWVLNPVDVKKGSKMIIKGEFLNEEYKVGAVQSRYRRNGVWYHPLNNFPGALFDAHGYVLFSSASEYDSCEKVRKGPDPNHIHVRGGIASLPSYVQLDPPPIELEN
jgi:hypothetical protein